MKSRRRRRSWRFRLRSALSSNAVYGLLAHFHTRKTTILRVGVFVSGAKMLYLSICSLAQ
jgi:hypothetical protein